HTFPYTFNQRYQNMGVDAGADFEMDVGIHVDLVIDSDHSYTVTISICMLLSVALFMGQNHWNE
ncbi:MAG: hypothetical protein AAGJ35_12060, partial [Myxococcota bacterium]